MYCATKVGTQNIFVSPQIANPQILGLIPQLQIGKILRCTSLQIRKFVMINP
jgi:hypothetical protein